MNRLLVLLACLLSLVGITAAQPAPPGLSKGVADKSYLGRGWISPLYPYVPCASGTMYQDGARVTQSGAAADQYRGRFTLTKRVSSLRFSFPNWYSAGTGANLCTYIGNVVTLDVTVEKIAAAGATAETSPRVRGKVAGGLTQTITFPAFATNAITDVIPIGGNVGDVFFYRISVTGGGIGTFYPNGGGVFGGTGNGMSRNNGEGQVTNVASRVDDGGAAIGGNATASLYGPMVILGNPVSGSYAPSLASLTDSIGVGIGATYANAAGSVAYRRGFIGQACDTMGIPFVRLGVGGTKLVDWQDLTKVYQRDELSSYCPVVAFELGTNDLGTSTATLQTYALTVCTRPMLRGQKLVVLPIICKVTTSSDSWGTVAGQTQSNWTNEQQRRVLNNWYADTTAAGTVTDEVAQVDGGGSSTVFYTRYPITGAVTAKVNGVTVTAPTVTDASLGKLTFGGAPAATPTITYTKQAGLLSQLAAIAPYGSAQMKFIDTRVNIEVSSSGAAFQGWTSSGYVGGYWKAGGAALVTSTCSTNAGSNTLIDTVGLASATTYQYEGYVVRITSGLGSGQTAAIAFENATSHTTQVMTAGWVTSPLSGDGYTITAGYTVDGTHPSGLGHNAMAAAIVAQSAFILTPLPATVAMMPSGLVTLTSLRRDRYDLGELREMVMADDRRRLVLR